MSVKNRTCVAAQARGAEFARLMNFVGILQAQCSSVAIGLYFLYPLSNGIFKVKGKHQYIVKVHAMHGSRALYVKNPKVTIHACLVA
jgi:hypothetical protein